MTCGRSMISPGAISGSNNTMARSALWWTWATLMNVCMVREPMRLPGVLGTAEIRSWDDQTYKFIQRMREDMSFNLRQLLTA